MINEVAFEQIQGNYWYGAYEEFRVVMMKDSGYINATKMCKDNGKLYYHWARQKHIKQLIRFVGVKAKKEHGGVLPMPIRVAIKATDNSQTDKLISGVYIHPDLIGSLACWISPEYALNFASKVVQEHLLSKSISITSK